MFLSKTICFSAKNIFIQHTTTLLSFHFRFVSFYLLAHFCCFTPTKRQKKRGKIFFCCMKDNFWQTYLNRNRLMRQFSTRCNINKGTGVDQVLAVVGRGGRRRHQIFGLSVNDESCSVCVCWQSLMGGWLQYYSFKCQPVDYSDNPIAIRVSLLSPYRYLFLATTLLLLYSPLTLHSFVNWHTPHTTWTTHDQRANILAKTVYTFK